MEIYKAIGKQVFCKTVEEHIVAEGVPTMKLGTYKMFKQCGSEKDAETMAQELNDKAAQKLKDVVDELEAK